MSEHYEHYLNQLRQQGERERYRLLYATPLGYSDLQVGDTVKIISPDSFRGRVGPVDYITPDCEWYQVRLSGAYDSDVIPFHRHELVRYP